MSDTASLRFEDQPVADPFEPSGVDWRPVDPKLATIRLLGLLIGGGPLVVVGVVLSIIWPNPWSIAVTGVVAAGLLWQAWRIPRLVRAMSYAIRDRDFFQRSGIMFRRLVIVPYVRIQYVDVNVGPLQRAFGLATLSVNTAAVGEAATLPGVTGEVASQLRDILTDRDKLTGVQDVKAPEYDGLEAEAFELSPEENTSVGYGSKPYRPEVASTLAQGSTLNQLTNESTFLPRSRLEPSPTGNTGLEPSPTPTPPPTGIDA